MKKLLFVSIALFAASIAISQVTSNTEQGATLSRPKLLVCIVVDQMRWDFLYRYYDRYQETGGLKRLLSQGFSCSNTLINYSPTITAIGHASIYTGSVPALHGIAGNDWWDYDRNNFVYCTQDTMETTVGDTASDGRMSPRNLLGTTIGDELMLATNFKSKVIGIALKDRGAILPVGHSATAAYWYGDKTGNWISSSYYMKELPNWVKEFNAKKLPDQYYGMDWNTVQPLNTYSQSTADEQEYETKPFGTSVKGFPYSLKQFAGKNYSVIAATPYGNSLTLEMAKAAVRGEQLGADPITDMLAISLSSTDYIGHSFGPNSVETEDCYLKLDKDLGDFLNYLDTQLGKGNYLLMLSADHGVSHVPAFLKEHKIPAGSVTTSKMEADLNAALKDRFRGDPLVISIFNSQVYLDRNAIRKAKLDMNQVYEVAANFLATQPGISRVFASNNIEATSLPRPLKEALQNGYYPSRSGDLQIVYQPNWIEGFETKGTTHGNWNPYDAHIPLLWYGWHIKPGQTNKEVNIIDIAPTMANLLRIQMPATCIGKTIEAVGN